MTAPASSILLAAIAAIAGVAVLRFAWSKARRSAALNGLGWLLLLAATLVAAQSAGAWGIAIAWLCASVAALAILAVAAATSPRGRASVSNRRVRMLAEAGEPRQIARRIATFLIVVVAGMAASIALGIAFRAIALGAGWSEADANATAFFAVPVIWGILSFAMLMQERRAQLLTLAISGLTLVPVYLSGAW